MKPLATLHAFVSSFKGHIAILLAVALLAQPASPHRARADDAAGAGSEASNSSTGDRGPLVILDRLCRLASQNASDDQKSQIEAIRQKTIAALQDIVSDTGQEADQRIAKARQAIESARDQIAQLLSPDQRKEFIKSAAALGQEARSESRTSVLETYNELRKAIASLDLSQDQKSKVHDALAQAESQMTEIRKTALEHPREAMEKLRGVVDDLRSRIDEILTSDQRRQLQNTISVGSPDRNAGRPPAQPLVKGSDASGNDDHAMQGEMNSGTNSEADPAKQPAQSASPAAQPNEKASQKLPAPAAAPAMAPVTGPAGPAAPAPVVPPPAPAAAGNSAAVAQVGQAAPDFKLEGLDDATFWLSRKRGRVILLEFGSLTSPSFRQRAAAMEKLYQQEQLRCDFIIIYTREAHPNNGWEVDRNKEDNIDVAQPADDAGRRALARRAQQMLGITIPIAIDAMTDATAKAYDGAPNAVIVIGRHGRIAGRQQWADPSGLKRMIDDAAAVANASGGAK